MDTIKIRPGLVPYALAAAVVMTIGSTLLKQGWPNWALVSWALLLPIVFAAIFDRIEFDGQAIRHRGPFAFVLATLFRMQRELRVSDIEAITTEATRLT